jgi:probable HAF family extracellular repeat protein
MKRMIVSLAVCGGIMPLGLASVSRVNAQGPRHHTFTRIDVPGATFTEVNGINARREIVGRYESPGGVSHGYSFRDGSFIPIDGPNAVFTGAIGINDGHDIVGRYRTADGVTHGFRLSGETLTSIDFSRTFTSANRINNGGDIAGQYRDDDGRTRGFLLSNETFTGIDVPDAIRTVSFGINDEGTVVGWYTSADQTNHGFLWRDGEFRTVDVPGAVKTGGPEFPGIAINPRGAVVGSYCAAEPCPAVPETGDYENVHGFLLIDDRFTSINVPGVVGTLAAGINARGDIVGAYLDTNGQGHGYIRGGRERDNRAVSTDILSVCARVVVLPRRDRLTVADPHRC